MNFFKRLKSLLKPTKRRRRKNRKFKTAYSSAKEYAAKPLLTQTELRFFKALKQATPANYIIYPQINLATIIQRVDNHKYQNELYRNIDFVIFDSDYNPTLLIEINDRTHNEKERRNRDHKVKDICRQANLPIIAFWTDYGIKQDYIEKKIAEYCK